MVMKMFDEEISLIERATGDCSYITNDRFLKVLKEEIKKAREEERERIIIKKDVIHCDTCKRIVAFTCGSCGEGVRPLTRQGNHYQTSYEPKRITCMDCIEKLKEVEK